MRHYLFPVLMALSFCLLASSASAQQKFLNKTADAWETELGHSDAKTRRNAAFALGKLGSSANSAVPRLKRALKEDKDGAVRDAAAWALGEIGKGSLEVSRDADLVKLLADCLKNDKEEPAVRRSAAYALGCFGTHAASAKETLEAALDESKNPPAIRQNVAWALGQIGTGSVPALRKALKDSDPYLQRDAAGALQNAGDTAREALPELVACIASDDTEVRKAALSTIVKLVGANDKGLIPALQKALSDPKVDVQRNAAIALGNIGGPEAAVAVPVLLDALFKGDRELRRVAASVIRNIGEDASAAVAPLIQALKDPGDEQLRAAAALSLGGIGTLAAPAVPQLVRRVTDVKEANSVRMEAATALAHIGRCPEAVKAVPELTRVLEDRSAHAMTRLRVLWALRVHFPKLEDLNVIPSLMKVLSEPKTGDNFLLRYECAYTVGLSQGPRSENKVLDVLLEFLKDDRIALYDTTKVKGGGINEAGAGTTEQKVLRKDDGRKMAVQALGVIGAERVSARRDIVTQLRVIANDKTVIPSLRGEAKELLEKLGK